MSITTLETILLVIGPKASPRDQATALRFVVTKNIEPATDTT